MTDQASLPEPIWVDRTPAFRAMLTRLRGEPVLAVDTESNSLYVYQEQVCLIQISVPGADYLLDPLTLDDISGLGPLFSDPEVLKIFHGAEYDLSILHRDFSFSVSNLFDTMWASRILGWPAHGLAALLETHFGVRLNKKYQRANWGLRPLPPPQLDYARLDTHYLLALQQIQAEALTSAGRWRQAHHRFKKMTGTHWEHKGFDPEGFWRMPGVRDLDDEGRGILRELYLFRDQRARARNRPPFTIISNKAMVSISEQRPRNLNELRRVKGTPGWLADRYGRNMLAAIRRGMERPLAWDQRPRNGNNSRTKTNGRPSAACQARFEALRSWRNSTAEARGVEPDIVLTNQVLWSVAHRNPRSMADLSCCDLLAPWQKDEFGGELLAVVQKR
jgi:ribonuclease D